MQLEGTENRIAVARRDFNERAKEYNIYVKTFPRVLLTQMLGYEQAVFFKSNEGASNAPTVQF